MMTADGRSYRLTVMAVEVKIPTVLRAQADGNPSVSVEGATVGEVFQSLVERFPGLREQPAR